MKYPPNPITSQKDVLWLNAQAEHVRIYIFLYDKHDICALLVFRLTSIAFSLRRLRKKRRNNNWSGMQIIFKFLCHKILF